MCVPCVRYKELASLADAWSCELRNTNRRCWFRYRVAEPEEGTEALGVLDRRGKEGRKHPPPGKQIYRLIEVETCVLS